MSTCVLKFFTFPMSKTWIKFGLQDHWFEDEPAVIWFRVMSLNLRSAALYPLGEWGQAKELQDELMVQSGLHGGSNCIGLDLNETIAIAADNAYFASAVRRVNNIFEGFGDVVESPCLKALGFSGQLAAARDTTPILFVGTTVLSMLSCTRPGA